MLGGLIKRPTTEKGRDRVSNCVFAFLVVVVISALALGISGHKQAMGTIHARALLTDGIDLAASGIYVYQEYKYIYDRPNCFSGPDGYLFVNGKLIIAETRNEQTDTPWGVMYWHGIHNYKALPEGWMPYPDLYL